MLGSNSPRMPSIGPRSWTVDVWWSIDDNAVSGSRR